MNIEIKFSDACKDQGLPDTAYKFPWSLLYSYVTLQTHDLYIHLILFIFNTFFPSIHPFSSDYPTQGHSCHRVRSQSAMDKLQICHRANT